MLPSLLSKFWYGAPEEEEDGSLDKAQVLKHTSIQENGEWIFISCGKP